MFNAPENLAWVILLAPLLAAVLAGFVLRRQEKLAAFVSIGAILISFVLTLYFIPLLGETSGKSIQPQAWNWIQTGDFKMDIGVQIDRLSLLMLLVVTGVGSLIHIYSFGYMKGDPGFSRFFASLSLFTFSMLGIVLSTSFFQMFIFWELVGLSSYLLIGFWFNKPSAGDACKKAFLTNRIGDFGFLLGIIMLWGALGSTSFEVLEHKLALNPQALGVWSAVIGLCIFMGAMGKSAQFPLHVWLPDAMEGPTPVSALIHAATMVAAGVYMLCRAFFIYQVPTAWPGALSFMGNISALDIIAGIGAFTALLAALMAVQQDDIKRILAYSTLSQLGYMVMAVGLGGTSAAMYHLTTHAFFKALLFLGAGSVIHALHHEQDIWKMGGLREKMPATFWTFLIATLALCGVPPLSGFYSKDDILAVAAHHSPILFGVAVLIAVLTTFYMFRLVFVAFLGQPKSHAVDHAHESPSVMVVPLWILLVPTIIGAFIGIQKYLPGPAHEHVSFLDSIFEPINHSPLAAVFGMGAVVFGGFAAWGLYANASKDPLPGAIRRISRAMRNRFYFDEIYEEIIRLTQENLAKAADWFDRWIIAGLFVRGISGGVDISGRALRLFQSGNLQTYAFLFAIGAALVILFVLRF